MTVSKVDRPKVARPQATRAAPGVQGAPPPAASSGWTPKVGSHAPAVATNRYGLTSKPAAGDWKFQGAVRKFQEPENIPPKVRSALGNASEAALRKGISRSWTQDVIEGGKTQKMTVELTKKLIPVPYEKFIATIPPSQWGGPNLARYLGGEVRTVATDARGRPTKQLERMVLAQDDLAPLLGPHARALAGKFANDMTKAETITYGDDRARVEWRVYGSNNGSTLADLGSVTFEKAGEGTLVTFHSAHRLGVPGTQLLPTGPITLPQALVGKPLESAFLAHANHYEEVLR